MDDRVAVRVVVVDQLVVRIGHPEVLAVFVVVTEDLEDAGPDRENVVVAERLACERRIVRPEDRAEIADPANVVLCEGIYFERLYRKSNNSRVT